MGLIKSIRKKEKIEQEIKNFFTTINAYTPAFTTFEGSVYESELCRAAIHAFALAASKLKPEIKGAGNERLERIMQFRPNPLMDTQKYIYRIATALSVDNNVIIAPLYDDYDRICGYWPMPIKNCQIIDSGSVKYVRYRFDNNRYGAIELDRCGIINNFQYKDDIWGASNAPLRPTMELINTQNQGIVEGIKSSAAVRFLAKLAGVIDKKTVDEERKRFRESNLSADNNGGAIIIDSKYETVTPIDSKPYIINSAQMSQIKENVFNYFGVNDDVLQNKFNSSGWNAFYEGKVETFALQMSLVHTNMTFNFHELAFGNEFIFTSNRMQYLEPSEKLSVVTQLFDRGMLTQNQGLEIFNLPPVQDGDRYFIRKEYIDTAEIQTGLDESPALDEKGENNAD